MKFGTMLATAILSLSMLTNAGNGIERYVQINFEKAQSMSERAQEKLQRVINQKCQPAASVASSLKAKLVNEERVKVDQGIIDVTYTVDVVFHGVDESDTALATVSLTDYAGTNPSVDWVEVNSLKTTLSGLCK